MRDPYVNIIGMKHCHKTQVIAEAGVLTFGEKAVGFRFVDEASKIGIKLLKFQCFVPEHVVSEQDNFWLERLKQRALTKADFLEIMAYGATKGIICFASTHNEYDLIDLSEAGMPILKIGSGDSNNVRMIDMALATGKPVILSTGLLHKREIIQLLREYRKYAKQLIIMHCTTIYPTSPELANLALIRELKKQFPQIVFGYSDHVTGYNVALAASAMPEVNVIEKHICLNEHKENPRYDSLDIPVALIPEKFKEMLSAIEEINQANKPYKADKALWVNKKWAQKAICARRDIPVDHIIEPDDLMSIRPYIKKQNHIPINAFYSLIGRKIKVSVKMGGYLKTIHFNHIVDSIEK